MNDTEADDTRVAHTTATGVELDRSGTNRETGVAYSGDYPTNHRMRAEALARDGATTDVGGVVSDELIADAAARIDAEEAERKAREERGRRETPTTKWTEARLRDEAGRRGVAIADDADKAAIVEAINAAPAATTEG